MLLSVCLVWYCLPACHVCSPVPHNLQKSSCNSQASAAQVFCKECSAKTHIFLHCKQAGAGLIDNRVSSCFTSPGAAAAVRLLVQQL